MPRMVAERADTLAPLAEVFREHGYEGASLSLIGKATGLGKGSLYHFFPGGKAEMASFVLADIDAWFEANVFAPLRDADNARDGIATMLDTVDRYFHSGRRVCLLGVLSLGGTRDRFAETLEGYFRRWVGALGAALRRSGHDEARAVATAEEVVAGIQGALVLARALDRPEVFVRALDRMRARLAVG